MAQELINMFNLIKEDLKMKREEVYQLIDDIQSHVNKLKGEYIALEDKELWSIRNGKLNNAAVQVHKYIEYFAKLAVNARNIKAESER